MKRPSFQFYPSDWLRDTALRSCSTGARGLWMDMICFMHEGSPYGHLKVGDKVILPSNLARMVGDSAEVVADWLLELSQAGVYETNDEGVIYSKRMIRDENLRQIRAAGGSKGGNPALMDKGKVNLEDKQKPTPSSTSSSSSSSTSKKEKVADALVLPDWMPLETWEAFLAMRKRIKKPPTDYAMKLLIDKLAKFKANGQNIQAVLEKSITSSWQDVFEINERQPFANKYDVAGITTPPPPNQDAALRKIEEDSKKAAPIPENIRAKMAELLKGKA
ncbi:MAG: hypothetical protein RL018_1314 [Pseudomonadota bacterium]|jgi:hypothetical protein